ncbi:hypothetical protein [uncultured Actinomyces sp.]|uniref:hypothetical protein n=1 Tax=uncultured Actinomyces sp. TaxID=249061 RepID=UPI0028EFF4D6|nr:hypothetical protein [uncultured Actinomyces sp.]
MRTLENLEKELQDGRYFDVLYDLVAADREEVTDLSYRMLLGVLDEAEFKDTRGIDGNRIQDAQELRADLIAEMAMDHTAVRPFPNVSMLEVMISIADRLGQITGDEDTAFWFWEMVSNLTLDGIDDTEFWSDPESYEEEILDRADDIININYDRDGLGGLFLLREGVAPQDMRDTELWYQMQYYANEVSPM